MSSLTKTLVAFCILTSLSMTSNAGQICQNSTLVSSTPSSRFLDNKDGTITDQKTGLMWKACSEGQAWNGNTCANTAQPYNTWQAALQAVQSINNTGGYAKHSDWRLPNIKELVSIVERQCYSPSINLKVFHNTPEGNFWTSSPTSSVERYNSGMWQVSFDFGYYFDYDDQLPEELSPYVRLVRNN